MKNYLLVLGDFLLTVLMFAGAGWVANTYFGTDIKTHELVAYGALLTALRVQHKVGKDR